MGGVEARCVNYLCVVGAYCVTVSLGTIPGLETLVNVQVDEGAVDGEVAPHQVTKQAPSLMSLLMVRAESDPQRKSSKVWLGAGLGSVSRRTYDKMLKWEFVDLAEF